jgi:predicted nuclease with TOPRIM domain
METKLFQRVNTFLGKDVQFWTLFGTIEELLNVAERQQKELEGYIDDCEQLEGMLRQANERIEELENKKPADLSNEQYKEQLIGFMQQVNPKPTMDQIEQLKQQYLDKRNI